MAEPDTLLIPMRTSSTGGNTGLKGNVHAEVIK
jgi:hypothetical protein